MITITNTGLSEQIQGTSWKIGCQRQKKHGWANMDAEKGKEEKIK